jgi:hypothetical protein
MRTKSSQIRDPLTYKLIILLDKIMGFVRWLELYSLWRGMLAEEQQEMLYKAQKIVDTPI